MGASVLSAQRVDPHARDDRGQRRRRWRRRQERQAGGQSRVWAQSASIAESSPFHHPSPSLEIESNDLLFNCDRSYQGGLKPWGETAWGSGRERERRADDGLVRERAEGAAQASLEGQVVVVVAAVADDGGKNLVSWLVC